MKPPFKYRASQTYNQTFTITERVDARLHASRPDYPEFFNWRIAFDNLQDATQTINAIEDLMDSVNAFWLSNPQFRNGQ